MEPLIGGPPPAVTRLAANCRDRFCPALVVQNFGICVYSRPQAVGFRPPKRTGVPAGDSKGASRQAVHCVGYFIRNSFFVMAGRPAEQGEAAADAAPVEIFKEHRD